MAKRRQSERLVRTRRRELSLAGGSVLLHLLLFLLLPGLALDLTPQRELLIELVQARAAGHGAQVAGHSTRAEAGPAQPRPEQAPAQQTPSPERPSPPEQPATLKPQPESADSQPEPGSPQANQATSISSSPVTVPQSPQQVQDQPVENEAVPVVDEPVAQPRPKPAEQPKPEPAPASQQPEPQDATAPAETGQDTPSTSPADEGASDAPAGGESTASADDGAEGEDEEGGGEPPGPSAAELQLLGEYGDAARLRIRSQARNPEQGGEGTVTFEFEVARDGHLIDVRVIRTSGYANLDNDALEATRAAFNERAEKKPFPRDVTVASWTFVMSLKYPLY